MLLEWLAHADVVMPPLPELREGLAFLRQPVADLERLPVGKMALLPQGRLFAIVQEGPTKPFEQGGWEAHRKYVDVQFVVRGAERMGFAPLAAMRELTPYDPDHDLAWFTDPNEAGQFVIVRAGAFTVFFPWDVHMPSLSLPGDRPTVVRKIVLKVAMP